MYKIPWGKILQDMGSVLQKQSSRCRKQTLWLAGGKWGGRRTNWEIGIDTYTTAYERDNQEGLTV